MSCVNTHGQTVRAASRAVTLLGFTLSFALAQGAFAQSARNSLDQHDQEVSVRLAAKFDDGTQQSQYSDMNTFRSDEDHWIDTGDIHISFANFCRDDSCKESYYQVSLLGLEDSFRTVDDAVVYRCETPKHTILIENDANKGGYTYRSWNKPKSTTDAPDLVLTGGSFESFGSGMCSYSRYSFKKGNLQINVQDGFACGDDDYFAKIPPNTGGELTVLIGGKVRDHYYCVLPCSK